MATAYRRPARPAHTGQNPTQASVSNLPCNHSPHARMSNTLPTPVIHHIAGGELYLWADESAGCVFISSIHAPGFPIELFQQDVTDLIDALGAAAGRLQGESPS